jgi:ketosteroid isomerase-like protein
MTGLSQRGRILAAAAITLAAGACAAAPAPVKPSQAEVTKVANDTVSAWTSMDAAKIKGIYGPGVVAFDFAAAPLETDRATFDKAQDAFAAAKFDGAQQVSRNLQILDADTFVMSGTWNITSSSTPANNSTVRCTDVFQKDEAGKWPIVNEHCSPEPTAA